MSHPENGAGSDTTVVPYTWMAVSDFLKKHPGESPSDHGWAVVGGALRRANPNFRYEISSSGELKPCPFCGGIEPVTVIIHDDTGAFAVWVECQHCAARGSRLVGWSDQDTPARAAREAWNEGSPHPLAALLAPALRHWRTVLNGLGL